MASLQFQGIFELQQEFSPAYSEGDPPSKRKENNEGQSSSLLMPELKRKAGGSLSSRTGLHSELQNSQGYKKSVLTKTKTLPCLKYFFPYTIWHVFYKIFFKKCESGLVLHSLQSCLKQGHQISL